VKTNKKTTKISDTINHNQALSILKTIVDENRDIAAIIEKLAFKFISNVDIDDIVDQVFSKFNFIDVEDVWDRSGSTRDGYVDPSEAAWDIF